MFALPESDAIALCKTMGLAIANAAMYGMVHAITIKSQNDAYDMLVDLLDRYDEVEWSLVDDNLLINGQVVTGVRGTAQSLIEQLRRYDICNFTVVSPLDRREFAKFLSIISADPTATLVSEGVDKAIVDASFKCIRVDKAVYERVGNRSSSQVASSPRVAKASTSEQQPPSGSKTSASKGSSERGRVFDLDRELQSLDAAFGDPAEQDGNLPGAFDITLQVSQYLEQRKAIMHHHNEMVEMIRRCSNDSERLEQLRQQLIDSGLSMPEWRSLLAESGCETVLSRNEQSIARLLNSVQKLAQERADSDVPSQAMNHALEAIGREVESMIQRTRGQADTLAQRVDADRGTISEIERNARDSGVGLNLSREELLGSLAEINQELVQPLTTSSAMLQLLAVDRIGALTEEQREILKTATDGMGRLEKLIAYLQRISGFPAALEPDRTLLSDAYDDVRKPPGEH